MRKSRKTVSPKEKVRRRNQSSMSHGVEFGLGGHGEVIQFLPKNKNRFLIS